jgi:hypothetical protein
LAPPLDAPAQDQRQSKGGVFSLADGVAGCHHAGDASVRLVSGIRSTFQQGYTYNFSTQAACNQEEINPGRCRRRFLLGMIVHRCIVSLRPAGEAPEGGKPEAGPEAGRQTETTGVTSVSGSVVSVSGQSILYVKTLRGIDL